jgi:hypothetical protein
VIERAGNNSFYQASGADSYVWNTGGITPGISAIAGGAKTAPDFSAPPHIDHNDSFTVKNAFI